MTSWSRTFAAAAAALLLTIPGHGQSGAEGFARIFNGRDLAGWHVSRTNNHGTTPEFRVEDGTLIAGQRPPGRGGVLLSDRTYADLEVRLEVQLDFGCDGGVFLRADERGRGYQVMLDYVEGGNIGGIYGEGIDGVDATAPDEWRSLWRRGAWNAMRIRIEGAVPRIQVWLNDRQITDWTDTANHAIDGATSGHLALQVHGGDRWTGNGHHRFRAIEVRELPARR